MPHYNDAIRNLDTADAEFPITKFARRRDAFRKGDGTRTMRPFVSWDGEGAGNGRTEKQDYCVIGNSQGGILVSYDGYLSSDELLEFIITEADRLQGYISVAYGFNYDINHILRDIPIRVLKQLHKQNTAHYGEYRLEWYPGKWLGVSSKKRKAGIRIYDTLGYWHTRLDRAIESDPLLRNDPRLETIKAGKKDRGTFQHSELDTKVIPYFHAEMALHADLCENFRKTLSEALVPCAGKMVDLVPNEWYGSSSIIKHLYGRADLKSAMNRPLGDLLRPRRRKHGHMQKPDTRYSYTLPDAVNRAARASFAGGRFEQFKLGFHDGPVYGYDITSAYPYAQTMLPQLRHGKWVHYGKAELDNMRRTTRHPTFGFYWCYFDFERCKDSVPLWNHKLSYEPPMPLFRRDEYGLVSYPPFTAGWYPMWSAELLWLIQGAEMTQAWIWEPSNDFHPFNDDSMLNFERMFELRNEYKNAGRADLAYALKITLNSGYGKTAQKTGVGLGDNLPAFHQIEWAAHITDTCRNMIYNAAARAYAMDALIAVETDAIYTTKPIPYLEEHNRPGVLGQYKRDDYDGICYLQSGIYFTLKDGVWLFHNRGLDRDCLNIEDVRYHLGTTPFQGNRLASLHGTMSNFTGIGQAGIAIKKNPQEFLDTWLLWPTQDKEIRLGHPAMKRAHFAPSCRACIEGIPPSNTLHDLVVPHTKSGSSSMRRFPWIQESVDSEFMDTERLWS